jgi:hypothetical protein
VSSVKTCPPFTLDTFTSTKSPLRRVTTPLH